MKITRLQEEIYKTMKILMNPLLVPPPSPSIKDSALLLIRRFNSKEIIKKLDLISIQTNQTKIKNLSHISKRHPLN